MFTAAVPMKSSGATGNSDPDSAHQRGAACSLMPPLYFRDVSHGQEVEGVVIVNPFR